MKEIRLVQETKTKTYTLDVLVTDECKEQVEKLQKTCTYADFFENAKRLILKHGANLNEASTMEKAAALLGTPFSTTIIPYNFYVPDFDSILRDDVFVDYYNDDTKRRTFFTSKGIFIKITQKVAGNDEKGWTLRIKKEKVKRTFATPEDAAKFAFETINN